MKINHYILIGFLVFLLFPIFSNTLLTIKPAQAQTSPVIYTSGSGTFNVPAGATDLVIEVWGGGGGGAGSINTNGVGSAGGGGGGYAKKLLLVLLQHILTRLVLVERVDLLQAMAQLMVEVQQSTLI